MKIAHISTERTFRGGERQLLRIHEGILGDGEESLIVCRSGNSLINETLNVSPYNPYFAPLHILRILKSFSPDIIHCHDSRALTFISSISMFLKAQIVYSRKTVFPMRQKSSSIRKFSKVNHFIAISEAAAHDLRSYYSDTPITIIHDGVAINESLSRKECRKFFGISNDTFIIATVGFFTKEKNVALLIKTADILEKEFPQAKLLLIGNVSDQVILNTLENHSSIHYAGHINAAEKYYNGFDHYISTSTQEGLGSALLDAVIRDIPVTALNSGGSTEVFTTDDPSHCHSEDKFLSQISNLGTISKNDTVVTDRGKMCRQSFSITQLQQNHNSLYHSLPIS